MATYRLKRKYFAVGAAVGKTLNALGGGTAKNSSMMNKAFGAMTVGGMGMTAISGKKQREEQANQNQQALQEQKNTINQLNNIAKS